MIKALTSHITGSLIIILLTGTTVVTSVAGLSKLSRNMTEAGQTVPEVKSISNEDLKARNSQSQSVFASPLENSQSGGPQNPQDSQTASANVQAQAGATVLATANSANQADSNLCIITLFGKKYDVTPLRNSHPGGDVFDCGRDNTSKYVGAHGTDVSRMQKYLYVESSSSQTQASNTGVSNSGSAGSSFSSVAGASASATTGDRCIITVFGKQYDVTSLRGDHPGGDVFVCGTDMSAAYQGAHGTSVGRLQPYLVTTSSTTGSSFSSGNSSGSSTALNSREDDDEDEREDEDENEEEKKQMEEDWEEAKKEAEKQRELEKKQEESEREHEEDDD